MQKIINSFCGIPVSISVTARLQIRISYGLFNIDRFINITRHSSKLPKKERLAINPKEVFIKVPGSFASSEAFCLITSQTVTLDGQPFNRYVVLFIILNFAQQSAIQLSQGDSATNDVSKSMSKYDFNIFCLQR